MSVAETDNAVSVFEQASIVGRKNESEPEAAIEVVHEVNELRGVFSVEIGSGLVGQHQRGTMDDGARHGDALALAAGEQIGAMTGAIGEAHAIESRRHPLAAFGALTPCMSSGNSTFSLAVKTGMRLKV